MESHSFPVQGALASYPQARSRPTSQQPQDLFLLIVLGGDYGVLCSPPPQGHLALLPGPLMGWPRSLALASHHTPAPRSPQEETPSPPDVLAAPLTPPVLQMVWIHFPKGSASDSPFTVHVLILGLCPIPCFFLYI